MSKFIFKDRAYFLIIYYFLKKKIYLFLDIFII